MDVGASLVSYNTYFMIVQISTESVDEENQIFNILTESKSILGICYAGYLIILVANHHKYLTSK